MEDEREPTTETAEVDPDELRADFAEMLEDDSTADLVDDELQPLESRSPPVVSRPPPPPAVKPAERVSAPPPPPGVSAPPSPPRVSAPPPPPTDSRPRATVPPVPPPVGNPPSIDQSKRSSGPPPSVPPPPPVVGLSNLPGGANVTAAGVGPLVPPDFEPDDSLDAPTEPGTVTAPVSEPAVVPAPVVEITSRMPNKPKPLSAAEERLSEAPPPLRPSSAPTVDEDSRELVRRCLTLLAKKPAPEKAARLHYEIARLYEGPLSDRRASDEYERAVEAAPDYLPAIRGARRYPYRSEQSSTVAPVLRCRDSPDRRSTASSSPSCC